MMLNPRKKLLKLIDRIKSKSITGDEYQVFGVAEYLHRESIAESAEFVKKHLRTACLLKTRQETWEFIVNEVRDLLRSSPHTLLLEFGVKSGTSINFFAKHFNTTIYGFDSFEGLPTNWFGWNLRKGFYSQDGKLPKVASNVKLVKGLIGDTLPQFLASHQEKISFIHIDTDLYEPAKAVLKQCKDRFLNGSIILFDELISYTGWKIHEFRALKEELSEDEYEFIAFSNYKQAAIRIKK
jgi:hypothetical protein